MKNQDISKVLSLGVSLNSENNMNALFQKALDSAMSITGSHAGVLYLQERDLLKPKAAVCIGKPVNSSLLPGTSSEDGSLLVRALSGNEPILLENLPNGLSGEDARVLMSLDQIAGITSEQALLLPLKKHEKEKIGLFALYKTGIYDDNDLVAAQFLATQTLAAISSLRYIKDAQLTFLSFVETMISAVETLTPYNANHTRNMVTYGINFILYLRNTPYALSEQEGKELVMSIWLHDIGKLCTPVDIMNKNTRLWPIQKAAILHRMEIFSLKARLFVTEGKITRPEAEEILRHTEEVIKFVEIADTNIVDDREQKLEQLGALRFPDEDGSFLPYLTEEEIYQLSVKYRTLTDVEFEIMHNHVVQTEKLMTSMYFPDEMSHVKDWACSHHELLNGKGYPRHLKGDEIPKEVRILTILDIFEALTATDRDYKKPKTPEEAIAHLHRIAGFGEVDETLVTLFEESRAWE